MFDNLGINTNELTENTEVIIIRNESKDVTLINDLKEEDDFGRYLNGVEFLMENINDDPSIQINVIRDGEEVDVAKFMYHFVLSEECRKIAGGIE